MTHKHTRLNGPLQAIVVGAMLTMTLSYGHVFAADPTLGPSELEMDQFTASYELNDGGLDPENKDQPGWPNDHDGRWSWMPWGKWAGIRSKAIMVWRGERAEPPLELTYPLPDGRYDVYLGVNHHTLMAAVEVRLGTAEAAGDFRWIRTPRAGSGTISNVKAGTATVTDGMLHLWLRNGRGYWVAIDYVRIGPVGFNPDRIGIADPSLLEPVFSPEVQRLRDHLAQAEDVSRVVMTGDDRDVVLCLDIAGLRTRPYVGQATAYLGGLDAGLDGDDRFVKLASHVYQNCNGRRHLLMGVERSSGSGPLLVECGYLRDHDGSSNVQVLWDGALLGTIDGSHEIRYLTEAAFVVPAAQAQHGRHVLEVREWDLTVAKQDFAWLDAVAVSGRGHLALCPPRSAPGPQRQSKLRLYDARYRPDRDPARRLGTAAADAGPGQREIAATGSFHFYIANDGPAPAENFRCYLDGRDIEALRHAFGTPYPAEPRLIWWRVRPRRIEPGGLAEVTIRFTRPPAMPASFTLEADNGSPLPLTVDAPQAPVRVEYVAFTPGIDRMVVYLESDVPAEDWDVGTIELDGVDVTARGKVHAAGRHHRMVMLDLARPLSDASHHALRVTDGQGRGQTVQVMAWSSIFQVGAFGVGGYVLTDQPGGNVNSIHSVVGAHGDGVSALRQFALRGVRQSIIALGEMSDDAKRCSSAILAYFLTDEPDAHDDPLAEGKLPWLGWGLQHYIDYGGVLQDLWPLPTTLVIDMTTRPDNLFVYGQSVDIVQHDPYFPPHVVRPQIRGAARAAAPHPAVAVLWAFSEWRDFPRPSPAVVRMNAYSALGAGAKGISHFACVFKNQGYGQVPELQQAVHALNAELLSAAALLNLSHPIVTDITVPEHVWARLLLCGERGAALVMVNDRVVRQAEAEILDVPGGGKTQIRKGDIIGFQDLGTFEASLELPPWLLARSVALATPEGRRPLPFEQDSTRLTCRDVTIGAGAMVLIER